MAVIRKPSTELRSEEFHQRGKHSRISAIAWEITATPMMAHKT
jgi:hypothetical protein